MLFRLDFPQAPLNEALGLVAICLCVLELLSGAHMAGNFALLLAMVVISNPPERAAFTLKTSAGTPHLRPPFFMAFR